ncbi:universal stress protein A-like protein [Silene latifolia]|uniref:universal stress protein A-like protein n=1 Tax=Silene latifolia TaxID=37657 RepID=UPI003D787282
MADAREAGKVRKIMVAMDESEESMFALSWCLKNIIVTHPSSEYQLVILHAKRPVLVYHGFDTSALLFSHDALSSLDRRDTDMAHWLLQKAEKLCKEYEVKMERRIEDGDPRDVICEMVNVIMPDLLVMGSHGYGLISRAIMGSVSNHCVQHASCPVLVVKMPTSSDASAPGWN